MNTVHKFSDPAIIQSLKISATITKLFHVKTECIIDFRLSSSPIYLFIIAWT
jgi:hypothetical protein